MRAAIANIGPHEFFFSRSYGSFHILPCPPHMPYVLTFIDDKNDRIDLGDKQWLPYPVLGPDIAKDLITNEYLAPHGVFLVAGTKPTKEELDRAEAVRDAYNRKKLAEGDELWAKHHSPQMIDDNSKRAAIALGADREWAGKIIAKIDCPGCGERILATIARHSCGWVVDIDKALAGGLIDEETAKRLKTARKKKPGTKPAADESDDYEDPAEAIARQAAAQQ